MDYTKIIEDFKNTQEFKNFLKLVDGKVISTDRQAKNGTIQVGNIDKHKAWGFFANGYVREGFYGILPYSSSRKIEVDSHSNIMRRPENKKVNLDLYLSGLEIILSRFNKRDDLQAKRIERLNSNTKAQKIAIHSLFDRTSIEVFSPYNEKWETVSSNYGIEDWSWDRIVETIGSVSYAKTHRIKK